MRFIISYPRQWLFLSVMLVAGMAVVAVQLEKEREACERGRRKSEAQAGQEEKLTGRREKGDMQANHRERTAWLVLSE